MVLGNKQMALEKIGHGPTGLLYRATKAVETIQTPMAHFFLFFLSRVVYFDFCFYHVSASRGQARPTLRASPPHPALCLQFYRIVVSAGGPVSGVALNTRTSVNGLCINKRKDVYT